MEERALHTIQKHWRLSRARRAGGQPASLEVLSVQVMSCSCLCIAAKLQRAFTPLSVPCSGCCVTSNTAPS